MSRAVPMLLLLLAVAAHLDAAPASNDLATAVLNAPAVSAARMRLEAAESRQAAAGRIPDPQIGGAYSQKQTPDEENPVWELSLQQPLPRAGERVADRRRALAVADMARAEFARMAGDVAAEAAMQLAEADTARHHLAVTTDLLAQMEGVLAALDTRLAAGQGSVAERLTLQTRIAGTRLMAARDEQQAWDAENAARAQLGLAAAAPLPDFAAPYAGDIDADQTPAIRLAAVRQREASAMAAMAESNRRPMATVGLQFQRNAMDAGNEDMLGLAVMTDIPWHSRGYARADVAAARAEQAAGQADGDTARLELAALLGRVARAELLAATARRLAAETEARLDAEYENLLSSAGTAGMGQDLSLLMLLDILEKHADVSNQAVEAEGAARVARAALWRHAPERFFINSGVTP